jgi:hypothetical protein
MSSNGFIITHYVPTQLGDATTRPSSANGDISYNEHHLAKASAYGRVVLLGRPGMGF